MSHVPDLTYSMTSVFVQAKYVAAGKWSIAALANEPDLGITDEVLETYRETAKFQFECGDYQKARDMLDVYISLFAKPPPPTEGEEEDVDGMDDGNKNKQQKDKNNKEDIGNPSIY